MKFCTRVRLKPSNDRGEFELDRARSNNNIIENLFALGHEIHNSINLVETHFATPLSEVFVNLGKS